MPSPRAGGEKVAEERMRGFAVRRTALSSMAKLHASGIDFFCHSVVCIGGAKPLIRRFAPPSPRLRGEKA